MHRYIPQTWCTSTPPGHDALADVSIDKVIHVWNKSVEIDLINDHCSKLSWWWEHLCSREEWMRAIQTVADSLRSQQDHQPTQVRSASPCIAIVAPRGWRAPRPRYHAKWSVWVCPSSHRHWQTFKYFWAFHSSVQVCRTGAYFVFPRKIIYSRPRSLQLVCRSAIEGMHMTHIIISGSYAGT